MNAKIGRNDLCPCGSGRKFKHCCLRAAVAPAMAPISAQALFDRAIELQSRARHREAEASYRSAIAIRPDFVEAYINLGNVLNDLGDAASALECVRRASALRPDLAELRLNLGAILRSLGRNAEAIEAYRQLIERRGPDALVLNNLGLALRDEGRQDEAIEALASALALAPESLDIAYGYGETLRAAGKLDAAATAFERALSAHPGSADVRIGYAHTLQAQGRLEAALDEFARVLALAPDHPESARARLNQAMCLLLMGDFARGLPLYEYRWAERSGFPRHRYPAERVWSGETDPAGRTLLVHAEQGYGDCLQFCRYASTLARRGARVVIEAPAALHGLLRSLDGVAGLRTADDPETAYDLHTPMLSLPLAHATRLDSIPADVPYLRAPDERVADWARRLGPASRRRIGIAWAGSSDHRNDANRSMSMHHVEGLVASATGQGVEWISLQLELRAGERETLARLGVREPSDSIGDFADTAALIQHLDLVVSVDTAVAHLAGALGRPVWVLLPAVPDWRWLLERKDSPWYPTARLYRQAQSGNWQAVLERVATDLAG